MQLRTITGSGKARAALFNRQLQQETLEAPPPLLPPPPLHPSPQRPSYTTSYPQPPPNYVTFLHRSSPDPPIYPPSYSSYVLPFYGDPPSYPYYSPPDFPSYPPPTPPAPIPVLEPAGTVVAANMGGLSQPLERAVCTDSVGFARGITVQVRQTPC